MCWLVSGCLESGEVTFGRTRVEGRHLLRYGAITTVTCRALIEVGGGSGLCATPALYAETRRNPRRVPERAFEKGKPEEVLIHHN